MWAQVLVWSLGGALAAAVLRDHGALRKALLARRGLGRRLGRYPSVSVIRPVRGLDPGFEENLAAALDTGYPGDIETIYVFDDPSEPALPIVRAAARRHRDAGLHGRIEIVIAGSRPENRTGKLNAMIAGAAVARGELIGFGDSDTRPSRSMVVSVVEALVQAPKAGCAFATVVVGTPAVTAGDVGIAMMLNALYGPAAADVAGPEGDLPFAMGPFMLFRREALEAIGGLEANDGELVDDMALGARVSAAGYRNILSPHPVVVVEQGRGLLDFLRTYYRWILFSRTGMSQGSLAWKTTLRGVEFWLGVLGAVALVVVGAPLAAALPALAAVGVGASMIRLHRLIGGAPLAARHLWVPYGLLLAAPFIFFLTLTRRSVTWRGRTYQLNAGARLAANRQLTKAAS